MTKALKQHLESITVENLIEFKSEVFMSMASSNRLNLGVNALGKFVVKTTIETFEFDSPSDAIDKYISELNKK